MKTLHLSIIAIVGSSVIIGILIISGTINISSMMHMQDKTTTQLHGLPITPGMTISLNGSSSQSPIPRYDVRPGQNVTLAIHVTSDPKNIPIRLHANPKLGFPKATGINWNLYYYQLGSPNDSYLNITIAKYVRAGEYLMEIDANTQAVPDVNFTEVSYFDLEVSQNPAEPSAVPSVSTVIVPNGTAGPDSGKNYEPRHLVVVLGVNNTVRWINESPTIPAPPIVAESHDDPRFWNATHSPNNVMLFPGKSFNFTFTQAGEFEYYTIVHSWMYGWVLVLPQSGENAIQTVTLNSSSGIPDPCETFGIPCPFHPNNYNFTAQKLGSDIYIEKFTGNGVDYYALIHNSKVCEFSTNFGGSCSNPDDLAILRFIGVDTSVPRQYADISITGLHHHYVAGESIDFQIHIQGYGPCDFPSVLITYGNSTVWKDKSGAVSCPFPMVRLSETWNLDSVGGPFSINQTGTYTVHVEYDSNSTESTFNVVPKTVMISNNETKAGANHESNKESIRIIPEYPITTGINKNGTITDSETIEILFDNFKQNLPLVIQIFDPQGGIYKVDTIPPSQIQSDGFYKYQVYLKGNESDMGKYNVVITHGNATASTSAYLSDAVP